ncbi:MAG: hypothetical protein JST91_04260 [Actinobacteria bacterium]|nr:hypothetical protein [Actinomycetota bacterium]
MNTITRRIAAGLALAAAPALIALGGAAISSAQTAPVNTTPSISHPAFPNQHNTPQPGTSVHHHHQRHHHAW